MGTTLPPTDGLCHSDTGNDHRKTSPFVKEESPVSNNLDSSLSCDVVMGGSEPLVQDVKTDADMDKPQTNQTEACSAPPQAEASGSSGNPIHVLADTPEKEEVETHGQMKQESPGVDNESTEAMTKADDTVNAQGHGSDINTGSFKTECQGAKEENTEAPEFGQEAIQRFPWLMGDLDDSGEDSEDNSDSDFDPETESGAERKLKSKIKGKQQKPRESPAKTAREYWQRKAKKDAEEEAENEDKKRKHEEQEGNPRKSRKTSSQSSPGKSATDSNKSRGEIFHGLQDVNASVSNGSVPSMGMIQATTHRDQLRQIKESIPEGCDTRRTATQFKDLAAAPASFGYRKVKADNGKWLLKGMQTGLMDFQIVAAAWMVEREARGLHPAGGMLADDMGIGKTITSLACIVGHPPEKEDIEEYSKATLVVLPTNSDLMAQWQGQIDRHCSKKLANRAHIFVKANKWRPDRLGRQWVIITTYGELISQFPKKKVIQQLKGIWAGDKDGFERALHKACGPLFKVDWYRIILDEAHAIKNRASSTTLACWQLSAKYRWVLSGTPISNSLDEFYPYLRFIGCRFAETLRKFRLQYTKGDKADENFTLLVSMIMFRRSQKDKFLGRKMVELPDSYNQDLWVPISNWERTLTKELDASLERELPSGESGGDGEPVDGDDESPDSDDEASDNKDNKANEKPKSKFLAQNRRCMRLRQAASHPFNLERFLQESERADEVKQVIKQFQEGIPEPAMTDEQQAQKAQDAEGMSRYSSGLKQLEKHQDLLGDTNDMLRLLTLVSNEHTTNGITCGICGQKSPPVMPVRGSNCDHIFCDRCLTLRIKTASDLRASGNLSAMPKCPIPRCSAELDMGDDVKTPACIRAAASTATDFREPGQDSVGTRWHGDSGENPCFFLATSGRNDMDFGPVRIPLSAKLKATMAVILTWLEEAPDDKIIVFVEFTRTAKVLGCMLERMGIDFLYYNRMATKKQKGAASSEFENNPKQKVLISSMKCGGVGFNMQVANRAIIVDLWWNVAAENQAFKRVQRIGQKKEMHFVRILVRGSIDDRISMLQDAKAAIVDRALQDNEAKPFFPSELHLRMLFSTKGMEDLIEDMDEEVRGSKAKA
ncbi:hypothetical protein FDECE_11499 [Fusarium decemcellulare]|nr:hypothetical protein FDECE_11499 [Fusarium decemcellulare]